jgi:hypothetical protein
LQQPEINICYPCIINGFDSEDPLREDIKRILVKLRDKRVRNYISLKSLKKEKYLISLNSSG